MTFMEYPDAAGLWRRQCRACGTVRLSQSVNINGRGAKSTIIG